MTALEVAADGGQDGGAASLMGPLITTPSESVPKGDQRMDSKYTGEVA